jgi:hypothetical protein
MTEKLFPNKRAMFSKIAGMGKFAPRVGLFIPKFRFAVFD